MNLNFFSLPILFVVFQIPNLAAGQNTFVDFEGIPTEPLTQYFSHDGSAMAAANLNLVGEPLANSFAGALGGSVGSYAALFGLVQDPSGNQVAEVRSTDAGGNNDTFVGFQIDVGAVGPSVNDYVASLDFRGIAGNVYEVRLVSEFTDVNNGFILGNIVGTGSVQNFSVAVSDPSVQDIGMFDPNDSSIEFAVASSGTESFQVDNISFVNTAVPEPSSTCILLALGGLITFRRRRRDI